MEKFLIDASIIGSSLEDFKRNFINDNTILIMSDLTFIELEAKKIDSNCNQKFARFLIDLFVNDLLHTEVSIIKNTETNNKHIDLELVKYAKSNDLSILTCDKGMALWCRFYDVDCNLLTVRKVTSLDFVKEDNSSFYINIFDFSVPKGHTVIVYSPRTNRIAHYLDDGTIFLNSGDVILVAHPKNSACQVDTYSVNPDMSTSLTSVSVYASKEEVELAEKPFHETIYTKWSNYMKKVKE